MSDTMHSALYIGRVAHSRARPSHRFARSLRMAFVDCDEIEMLRSRRLLRDADFAFRRADYLPGSSHRRLSDEVRSRVESQVGWRPTGPIALLTQLRHLGLSFEPVRFYYCLSPDRAGLQAVLAEVTNTPWGERHEYVVAAPRAEEPAPTLTASIDKSFHVSPFMDMEAEYRFRFSAPGQHLRASIETKRAAETDFVAALDLDRLAWTPKSMARSRLRFPWMPAQVLASVYWQALRLWWIGARFHSHPRYAAEPNRAPEAR